MEDIVFSLSDFKNQSIEVYNGSSSSELAKIIAKSNSGADDNCYFITKRFDITDDNKRLHMHSLSGILGHDASSFTMGYESLFRVGLMLSLSSGDKEQMFKTMAFNIVFANRDDHARNFSFLMDENCNWSYAPAYDMTYSVSNHDLNWHQLTIDKKPTTLREYCHDYGVEESLKT